MRELSPKRLLVLLALLLTAFSTAQDSDKTTPKDYVIGPEDILTIITRDMPEASGDFMVRPDGTLSFPIAGTVKAAGLTPTQLQQTLEKALAVELRNPVVTVNVKQMRMSRIYITGIVSRPNLYDFKPGWRLTELIAAAGGLAMPPERLTATVFRVGQPNRNVTMRDLFVVGKDDANLALQPGDVVNIRSEATIRVNVVGKVARPGTYDVQDGHGAVEAVAAAGGHRDDAALSKAKIVRKNQETQIDLHAAITKGESKMNVPLQDGDTVYIPELFSRISVMGTVNRPGTHLMPDGRPYTLTQAIGDAGGQAQQAKVDGIVVARQDDSGRVQQFQFNLKEIMSGKAPDFELKDRDVVFVPQSGKTNPQQIGVLGNLWFMARSLFGIR